MNMLGDIVMPIATLAGLAGLAPALWARFLPEGVPWLMLNAILSILGCAIVAMAWRYGLSWPGWGASLRWLGLSALIWGPVVLLSLAQQPRRWKDATW
ncbi:hypothetical protein [Palleronia sp. LCG004]|uniref:hypothetical protein n=1 Tax=Palleronia sp. LCG004 TaxID=3079304 RepID=UPI002941F195|nr:hypothetical protein [Palleronia sp. LCG004]WOI57412.1 hypothetical protein RVY76_06400 [Palleronia sp. LCG004]